MRKHLLLILTLALAAPMIYAHCGSCCNDCGKCDDCCKTCCDSSSCCDDCCDCWDCCDDCVDCECVTTGKTFFTVRPQWQTCTPERVGLFRNKVYLREDGRGGAMQLGVFFGRSTDKAGLRSYFFPKNKGKLNVKEEFDTPQLYGPTGDADLHPQHFRVISNNWMNNVGVSDTVDVFESQITMCPRQSVVGLGFAYRQNLTKLMKDDAEERDYHVWFEVATPLTRVKNNLCLNERFVTTMDEAGGVVDTASVAGLDENYLFFSSMKDAFAQKAWCYGKICGCRKKTGLADIEFKLGTQWVRKDSCRMEGYAGLLVPTGNRVCAEYMFEPIVGHNKHFGIMTGLNGCFKVWENIDEGKSLRVALDSHGLYLFKKCEKRSFDLKCRPWSRYMEVYANKDDAQKAADFETASQDAAALLYATPGINIFTKDLCVRPRVSATSNWALIFHNMDRAFSAELGLNFYMRQRECVEMKCVWKDEVALKGYGGAGTTSIFRKIDFDASLSPTTSGGSTDETIDRGITEYEESIIKLEDLDLESAAHPGIVSYTAYLMLGKQWDDREYPLFMTGGFSYEYGSDNTAMSRWLVTLKGGISF